jgi:hypothetical protein
MSYRDVSESLRAYRDRVAGDLEEARRAAQEAADRAGRVSILEKELAETDGLLAKLGRGPRTLPLLENIAIAAPCSASWDEMVGDDRIRFCGHCEKNVYNLSALPREEAEALVGARDSKMCVRLYKRADGTVLTSDCPVGVKRRRRRRAVAGVVGGGMLAAAAASMFTRPMAYQGDPMPAVQGSAVMMGAPPPTPAVDPTATATATEMGKLVAPMPPKGPKAPTHTMGRPVSR